jgi:hypothetical protein
MRGWSAKTQILPLPRPGRSVRPRKKSPPHWRLSVCRLPLRRTLPEPSWLENGSLQSDGTVVSLAEPTILLATILVLPASFSTAMARVRSDIRARRMRCLWDEDRLSASHFSLLEIKFPRRSRRADYLDANAPAGEPPATGGSVISIAQIAAGRIYIEARKLPSIS